MAPEAEEGRDKLRKAARRSLKSYETRISEWGKPIWQEARYCYVKQLADSITEGTRGTETSKYPEEKKANAIPQVAASERGTAQ